MTARAFWRMNSDVMVYRSLAIPTPGKSTSSSPFSDFRRPANFDLFDKGRQKSRHVFPQDTMKIVFQRSRGIANKFASAAGSETRRRPRNPLPIAVVQFGEDRRLAAQKRAECLAR
jgi:hypothetical protein